MKQKKTFVFDFFFFSRPFIPKRNQEEEKIVCVEMVEKFTLKLG